jgi:hypothetical protein
MRIKNDGHNRDTGELISDLSPDHIPDKDKNVNVKDFNYSQELYSDTQLLNHANEGKNVYTVDNIPSRYEHNKLRSNHNFDPFSEKGDEFDIVCTFKGDWSAGLKKASAEGHESTIGNYRPRGQSLQDKDLSDGEMMDIKRASGKEDLSCMYQVILRNIDAEATIANDGIPIWKDNDAIEYKPFFKMAEMLGIEVHQLRINIQLLGQVTPMHIDQQMRYARPQWRRIWKDGGGDKDPLVLRRVLVMLNDWVPGHSWLMGNNTYDQYHAGEAIVYDWCNMPHGTANFSYDPRFTLQITGFVTDKTKEIMAKASKGLIIEV